LIFYNCKLFLIIQFPYQRFLNIILCLANILGRCPIKKLQIQEKGKFFPTFDKEILFESIGGQEHLIITFVL